MYRHLVRQFDNIEYLHGQLVINSSQLEGIHGDLEGSHGQLETYSSQLVTMHKQLEGLHSLLADTS